MAYIEIAEEIDDAEQMAHHWKTAEEFTDKFRRGLLQFDVVARYIKWVTLVGGLCRSDLDLYSARICAEISDRGA